MTITLAHVGARLAKERERLGYTLDGFAQAIKMSREGYRLAENGGNFRVGLLIKSVRLGVDCQYVITGVRSENVEQATLAELGAVLAPEGAATAMRDVRTPFPIKLGDETRRLLSNALQAIAVDLVRDVPRDQE